MKYKIFVEIKTYATSLFVQLEQNEIGLSYDGDNSFKATKEIDITNSTLDLIFQCVGLNGTDWEIGITINDAEKPLFKKKGTIVKKNYSLLKESISVPN